MAITFQNEIVRPSEYQTVTITKLEDFKGFSFESSSSLTNEFVAFAKMFIQRIKQVSAANGLTVLNPSRGHFYVSGFVRNNTTEKMAYFSISDVRYFPEQWHRNILIRSAQHEKDYTGGDNQSATLENIGECLISLTR